MIDIDTQLLNIKCSFVFNKTKEGKNSNNKNINQFKNYIQIKSTQLCVAHV